MAERAGEAEAKRAKVSQQGAQRLPGTGTHREESNNGSTVDTGNATTNQTKEQERQGEQRGRADEETSGPVATAPSTSSSASESQAASTPFAAEDEAEKRKKLLTKLSTLLADDKKFPKAAGVLRKFMETDLKEDTSDEFVPLLQKLDALSTRRQKSEACRTAYKEIFELAHRKLDAFSEKHTFQLRTMVLFHVTCYQLDTDDTYQFAQAAKVAHEAIEQLDTAFPKQSDILLGMEVTSYVPTEQEKRERLDAIVRVLEALYQHRKKQWAKTSVDLAFKLAGDRRFVFDKRNRDRIDDMYDSIKELRSTSTLGAKRSANARGIFRSWAA